MTTHVVFVNSNLRFQFWVDRKRICVCNYCLSLGDVKLIADGFKQMWLCVELNSVLWRGTFYLRSHHPGIKGKRITIWSQLGPHRSSLCTRKGVMGVGNQPRLIGAASWYYPGLIGACLRWAQLQTLGLCSVIFTALLPVSHPAS